jgi:hypothetical protein
MAIHNQIPKYYDKNGNEVNIDDVIKSLGSAAQKNVGDNEGDIPQLGAGGKIASSHIPSLAITHTFVVNSQEEMLALGDEGAEQGDVCKREDLGQSYILTTNDPTDIAAWVLLTDMPTTDAIPEGELNKYFTPERAIEAVENITVNSVVEPENIFVPSPLHYVNDPANTVGLRVANLVLNNLILQRENNHTVTEIPMPNNTAWKTLAVSGKYVLAANYDSSYSYLSVIDTTINSIALYSFSSSDANQGTRIGKIAVGRRYVYFGDDVSKGTLRSYDMSSSSFNSRFITMPASAKWDTLAVSGKYVYVGSSSNSVNVVKIDTTNNAITTITMPAYHWFDFAANEVSRYVYALRSSTNSSIYAINKSTNAVTAITMPDSAIWNSFAFINKYLYVGSSTNLSYIVKIDTTNNAVTTITMPKSTAWNKFAVCGRWVLIGSTSASDYIAITSINDINPDSIYIITMPDNVVWGNFAVCGKYAFVGSSSSVPYIVKIDTEFDFPANSTTIINTSYSGYYNFAVSGKYVIAGRNGSGPLVIIDSATSEITTRRSPTGTGPICNRFVVSGKYVYVGSSISSDKILAID